MRPIYLMLWAALFVLPFNLYSQTYTNVALPSGVEHYYGQGDFGGGVSFYDFNGDGWDDLTFATAGNDSIYFYLNTGGSFQQIQPSLIDFTGEAKQVIWADMDNDGDADLFVGGHLSGNHLYENTGNLNLVDITASSGISTDTMPTFGASWADYDKDGLLDLYIVNRTLGGTILPNRNYFYRNLGNNLFQDVTLAIGVADSNKAPFCASFLDVNNDGWEDLYVAHDKYLIPNTLYKNDGNGGYTDISAGSGADVAIDAMCVAVGDYNHDQYQDIYVTNTAAGNSLLLNNGDETFTDTAFGSGVGFFGPSWGANFFDYDNDLDLDLYVSGENISVSPGLSRLYANDGTGMFAVPAGIGFAGDTVRSFSNALGDINRDGYMDIAVSNWDTTASNLWLNSGGSHHWFRLDLEGTVSNRDAIGTRIEYWVGGEQYLRYTHCGISFIAQNTGVECFGLGTFSHIDTLVITWPNGLKDRHYGLCADQTLYLQEGVTPLIQPQITCPQGFTICEAGDSLVLEVGNFTSYQWSTGDTTPTLQVTGPDTIWVEVQNAAGICARSQPIVVQTGSTPNINPQLQDLTCHQDSSGSIDPQVSGGQSPYTYHWSNGSSDSMLTQVPTGIYVLTTTDAQGCSRQDSFLLMEPAPISTQLTSTPSDTLNCLGTALGLAMGGTPPYTYLWNDPSAQTDSLATGLCPGMYTLLLTDVNGCSWSDTISVADTTTITPLLSMLPDWQLRLWPQPAESELELELQSQESGTIYLSLQGLAGRELLSIQESPAVGPWRKRLQVGQLPAGTYLLQVRQNSHQHTQQIILSK